MLVQCRLPHAPASDRSCPPAQGFRPDLLLGEVCYPCSQLIAARLNVSWVNYWALAPLEPQFTSLYSTSNRRFFFPNPISYFPQMEFRGTSQHLVRGTAI